MLFRRLFGPVFIGLLAASAYYAVNFLNLNAAVIEVNEFYGEQFFAVLSTLYAIITALVLIKGLENVDGLGGALRREATQIRCIASLSRAFVSDTALSPMRNLRAELGFYVANILEQQGAAKLAKNNTVIDNCRKVAARLEAATATEAALQVELIKELEALRQLRAERGARAQQRLPGYLIWMLAAMTVVIILPFFIEHVDGVGFNYYAIFAISAFGSFIIFMMSDINRPYDGLWTVDFTPFEEAAATLEETA